MLLIYISEPYLGSCGLSSGFEASKTRPISLSTSQKYGWPAHLRAPIRTSRAFKLPRLRNLELRNCLIDRPLIHFLWINRDSLRRMTFTDFAVRHDPSPQASTWPRVFELFETLMPLLKEVNIRTTKEDFWNDFQLNVNSEMDNYQDDPDQVVTMVDDIAETIDGGFIFLYGSHQTDQRLLWGPGFRVDCRRLFKLS